TTCSTGTGCKSNKASRRGCSPDEHDRGTLRALGEAALDRAEGCGVIAFILRRLVQSISVMLVVALIAFSLFRFVGDPINNMVGQDTGDRDREELRQELGLNDP